MIETLDADHVRLARAKGLSRRRVLVRHVLRNALIPVTTVIALDFAAVLGGAIITEIVFGWQGLGQWYLDGRHQPRRQRDAGLPADHGHLRDPLQPGRRHPLRRTRPEDPLCLSRWPTENFVIQAPRPGRHRRGRHAHPGRRRRRARSWRGRDAHGLAGEAKGQSRHRRSGASSTSRSP